jgi:dTDP-4-dehydrorhamnose 3,5-epimerase
MKFSRAEIPDIIIVEPNVFKDGRGYFFESFKQNELNEFLGYYVKFCQDNESKSSYGVLRGLHYQLPPMAQGKLVRVTQGEVFDVAVDIRKSSLTFGKWVGEILSAENAKQMWIPEGFAHGFITLSETAEFLYKTTNYYSPEHELCIAWDDKNLNVVWPVDVDPQLSAKDLLGKAFTDTEEFS